MILAWITDRLRESAGSKSLATNRDLTFQPTAGAMTKPHGPPPMPEKLPAVKLPQLHRKLPIVLMDASPWAPLVAVAGQEHVRLLHTPTHEELGVLPFPEGVPHVIRFSRDGTVLLVAGGKPVQSGKAVLFDVRSGKRLAEIGDELDAVLAADLSPDQQLVAIGSSGKIVKVYRTSDGLLKYKLTRHTDWITEIGFSPDGNKLATADRSGGLHLWKPKTGQGHRLFHSRVGQARFERRPTSGKRREIMVGRRDEAPLVPPYRFLRPNKAMALLERISKLARRASEGFTIIECPALARASG